MIEPEIINNDVDVRCPRCLRTVRGYVPKQGDGTLWFPRRHKCARGEMLGGFLCCFPAAPAPGKTEGP